MDIKERSYRRTLLILGISFCIMLGLVTQLFRIQIINYERYSRMAVSQRRKVLINHRIRGVFLDRNGKMLRGPATEWYLLIQTKLNADQILKLTAILSPDFSTELIRHQEAAFWIYSKPLAQTQINSIYPLCDAGLKIIARRVPRDYDKPIAWHLLGFVDQNQGFSGLEYLYEPIISGQGKLGSVFAITDGLKNPIPGLGYRNTNGTDATGVLLTIDESIQKITDAVLDREKITGAVVILDAKSGEILAMSSRPLVKISDPAKSLNDDSHPFLNRAVSSYNPGSIFKLVILSAGLDKGKLEATEQFTDQSFYRIGDKKWFCTTAKKSGHGLLSLSEALAYSCNPVFIEIALRLRPELILEYADRFGLGKPCNIGLKDESWGELPSGIGMSYGEQANLALGQQTIYTTPLQIASLVQTIANNGIRQNPRLVKGFFKQQGAIQWLKPEKPLRVLTPETSSLIKEMMAEVVNIGTGKEAGLPEGVAGKTGTAQTGTEGNMSENAWFAGFTPLDNPQYAVAVFCEKGISGGKTAAPIFREIMAEVMK